MRWLCIRFAMPLLQAEPYISPCYARGPHAQTILPNLTRRRIRVSFRRDRLVLPDGDFLDLDFALQHAGQRADTCVLILHGLEGSSKAPYVKSLIRGIRRYGFDACAMNMRGCSEELNRVARFYHSGETADLAETIAYLERRYHRIALVGFSLGGNIVLKYLGEAPRFVSHRVFAGVAVSAPVDLEGSAKRISQPDNRFYMSRFIRLLSSKIERKAEVFPELVNAKGVRRLKTFQEFDDRYTAPLNGFEDAEDYWNRCSANNWLGYIERASLLLNARNDPFLSDACFPEELCRERDALFGLFPEAGGHLGFPGKRVEGAAWHERVILDFIVAALTHRV